MHSDVVLMKSFLPDENETRQLQDIPPPELDAYLSRFLSSVKKQSGDQHEPTALRRIIASVERYLKNLSYSQSIIEGQRSTVESFERHLFKRFSQFRDETVDHVGVCRRRVATFPPNFKDDHIRVNR